ncbi:MAG: transglutaminase-like domain-containing protein [Planctomycetota bacterium]
MISKRRFVSALTVGLLLLLMSTLAASPAEVLEESWHRNLMMGTPAGSTHEIVRTLEENGRSLIETTTDVDLTMKRMAVTISIRLRVTFVEDARTGEVVRASQHMDFSNSPTKTELEVQGGRAKRTTTTAGKARSEQISWDPEIRGPQWQLRTMREHGLAPGKVFAFREFAFEYGQITTRHFEVVGSEEIEVSGRPQKAVHLKNWVEAMSDLIADEWRDDALQLVRSRVVQAGMELVSERCSREEAMMKAEGEVSEVFLPLSPQANLLLPDPYHLEEAVLLIKPIDASRALPDFGLDERQVIEERGQDGSVRLRIQRLVPPADQQSVLPLVGAPAEIAEDLLATPILQADDPEIRKAAEEATHGERNAWKAAQKLERFVFNHIDQKGMDVAFATAREVLDRREGDCSEHGVLLATLCRAAGIPSRVALGLLYFNGAFGGHMWTEVWLAGRWYALDGTLGLGMVDAVHLRFDVSSLKTTGIADSLTGMMRGLGNIEIAIEEFRHGDRLVRLSPDSRPYKLAGRHYVNPLVGVALDSPEGWAFTRLDPEGIQPLLLRLEYRGEESAAESVQDCLEVFVFFGAGESPMELAAERTRGRFSKVELDVPRRVDGRDGRLLTGKTEKGPQAIALVGAHDAAFLFVCRAGEGETAPVGSLSKVLETVDFDVKE